LYVVLISVLNKEKFNDASTSICTSEEFNCVSPVLYCAHEAERDNTSQIGIKYLGYVGNTYLLAFNGCPPVPEV